MSYLLDTHVLLWWLTGDPRLDRDTHELIADGENPVCVSAASVLELAIKESIGKLRVSDDILDAIDRDGFRCLSMTREHAWEVRRLPPHHRDPFDRILIAQARVERLTIVTHDRAFGAYQVPVHLV